MNPAMKALLASLALAVVISACTDSSTIPGSVTLTISANANCAGTVDTVDVQVNDLHFGTVIPGGAAFSKSLAPMRYTITATSRNGVMSWSEEKNLLSSYTFECGCE
jgi:hypothetical protein